MGWKAALAPLSRASDSG